MNLVVFLFPKDKFERQQSSSQVVKADPPVRAKHTQTFYLGYCVFVSGLAFFADFFSSILLLVCLMVALLYFVGMFLLTLRWGSLRTLFAGLTTVAILVSLGTNHWALKARFFVSRGALQAAVEQTVTDSDPVPPRLYGLFWPARVRFYPSSSNAVAFDESRSRGSFDGVVYAPSGRPPGRLNYGNSYIELAEHWYYVHGD